MFPKGILWSIKYLLCISETGILACFQAFPETGSVTGSLQVHVWNGQLHFIVTNRSFLKGDTEKNTGKVLGFLRVIFLEDLLAREMISPGTSKVGWEGQCNMKFLSLWEMT